MQDLEHALNSGESLMIYITHNTLTGSLGIPEGKPRISVTGTDLGSLMLSLNKVSLDSDVEKFLWEHIKEEGVLICQGHQGTITSSLSGSEAVRIPAALFEEVDQDGQPRFWTDDRGILFCVSKENGAPMAAPLNRLDGINPWEKDIYYKGFGKTLQESLMDLYQRATATQFLS